MSDETLISIKIDDESNDQQIIAPMDSPNMCKWCLIYTGCMGVLLGIGIVIWIYS